MLNSRFSLVNSRANVSIPFSQSVVNLTGGTEKWEGCLMRKVKEKERDGEFAEEAGFPFTFS